MIKFNLDICTTRRLSGWVFNINEPNHVVKLRIVACGKSIGLELTERNDVAEAFSLPHAQCGIEINIPDLFDSLIDDYKILIGDHELFSYQSQIQTLRNATRADYSAAAVEKRADDAVTYKHGRHVVFFYENPEMKTFLDFLSQPKIRRSFPKLTAGCEFSHIGVSEINTYKDDILSNLKNILIILPSHTYERIYRVSPTIIESGKLVTLYSDGSLKSSTKLHEHQINNFIASKTKDHALPESYQSSFIKIWEFIENYASLVFNQSNNLYFLSSNQGGISNLLSYYIANKVQGKRTEDILRIKHEDSVVVLVNMSAYMIIFDMLGTDDCWAKAISRGLTNKDLVI